MSAIKLVRQLLDKVYHRHGVPASVKAVKDLPALWVHETLHEAVWSWLASFITLYTLLEVKS